MRRILRMKALPGSRNTRCGPSMKARSTIYSSLERTRAQLGSGAPVDMAALIDLGRARLAPGKSDDGKLRLSVRGHKEELPVSNAFQYRFKGI